MGSVTDPYWLGVFDPIDVPLKVASDPNVRREKETDSDALLRILGNPSMLERLQFFTDAVRDIEEDDRIMVYKIGDGQRKNPLIRTVGQAALSHDVDLREAF